MNKFQLGQEVTWSSQAQGVVKTKVGVVVEVIPAGEHPDRERFEPLYRGSGVGSSRNHESYVVEAFDPTGKSSVRKVYWPRTAALRMRKAKADQQQIIRDLIAVATGQVDHLKMGQCPDQVEGHETRDHDCPACRAIMAAEQLAK